MNMHKLNKLLSAEKYYMALELCEVWYQETKVFKSTALWYCRYCLEKLGQ